MGKRLLALAVPVAVYLTIGCVASDLSGQRISTPQQTADLLRTLVPEAQQLALSLDRLTSEQRSALSILLLGQYFAGLNDAVQESYIDGSFEGWDGDTIIELTDGTVFRQQEYHYEYSYSYRPEVMMISRPFGYEMWVEGSEEIVEVELLAQSRFGRFDRNERFRSLLISLPEDAFAQVTAIAVCGRRNC